MYVGFFCFKEGRGKRGGNGESPTVKVEPVNLELCCIYNFHTVINI